ncbi:Golgi-associated plant pathogenesis-related protein 1-like [Engraulis encrasicolus]|uniref:Golgi-associated plant pathogenesis-related protein 1-like n=1 Tax=Engraulis encrasicolus TaxID=184585 RepID=UPI002FD6983B
MESIHSRWVAKPSDCDVLLDGSEVGDLPAGCQLTGWRREAIKVADGQPAMAITPQLQVPGAKLLHCQNNAMAESNHHALPLTDASFKAEFLRTHNELRAKHGAPPLTLTNELNKSAQEWADYLENINKNNTRMTLKHSDSKNGENLYYYSSSRAYSLTGKEAVQSWYNEIKDYDFSDPGFAGNTGHFTQVVWKSTTELGVGVSKVGNATFVVGQYNPAGNFMNEGYFEKNVLPAA